MHYASQRFPATGSHNRSEDRMLFKDLLKNRKNAAELSLEFNRHIHEQMYIQSQTQYRE